MIHSLARFIGTHSPAHLNCCTELRSIPFKKTAKTLIAYLEKCEIYALLKQPDHRTALGTRDHILLLILYNSGARTARRARFGRASSTCSVPSKPRPEVVGSSGRLASCGRRPKSACRTSLYPLAFKSLGVG
jgi:integrase/recombinase XerD